MVGLISQPLRFTSPFNRLADSFDGLRKTLTMFVVYILKSLKDPKRHYVGITVDLERRLKEHNNKQSVYSSLYAPWEIETFVTFRSKVLAEEFERYLKTGSGNTFLRRRLLGAK